MISVPSLDAFLWGAEWSPAAAFGFAMVVIFVLDLLVQAVLSNVKEKDGARWFLVHSCSNFFVVLCGLRDVIVTFDQPTASMSPRHAWSPIPGGFVAAIHIYHCLRFELKGGDLFHHLAFALVGCGSNYIVNYGPIANTYFFFICGLPGMIDYYMLGMCKLGKFEIMEEKRINAFLNVWIRGPGLTAVFAWAWAAYKSGDHEINIVIIIILTGISLGNGQYYLERVVYNHGYRQGKHDLANEGKGGGN